MLVVVVVGSVRRISQNRTVPAWRRSILVGADVGEWSPDAYTLLTSIRPAASRTATAQHLR
jgi:hypothetical protein